MVRPQSSTAVLTVPMVDVLGTMVEVLSSSNSTIFDWIEGSITCSPPHKLKIKNGNPRIKNLKYHY